MLNPVTVVIPIGPHKDYLQWLPAAIQSVFEQTVLPGEILLLDDGSSLVNKESEIPHTIPGLFPEGLVFNDVGYTTHGKWIFSFPDGGPEIWVSYWKAPWNIGFAPIFNCGVGLALYDNILYLASDDTLGPECVADCLETWNANQQKDAWYSLTYVSNSGGVCSIPINAAMVTRNLWKWMGGFPPSAFAGPDALMLSRLMVHDPYRIIKVKPGKVNYFIREHPEQETKRTAQVYSEEMTSIRNKATANFVPNGDIILK